MSIENILTMRTRRLTVTGILGLALLVSVAEGNVLLAESNGSCCGVDRPEDAPPVSDPGFKALSGTSTGGPRAPGNNIKKFRTDSGPELDWYQPCSGGDNLIDFDINVHDVDTSAVKSATLTVAVWDVDYACSISCCERDSVYLNGHRLMTPEPYLTGANGQWSTCTFDVEPEWLKDGNNRVDIYIDLFCPGYWCVTCDWGELQLELEEIEVKVVEIKASRDVGISDKNGQGIGDPIWKHGEPSEFKPLADAMRDSWILFTTAGYLNIEASLEGLPARPQWTPKCKYAWWVTGSGKSGSGEFTGWSGTFKVETPQNVGIYNLRLAFDIYDDDGNKVNTQDMKHKFYVTYEAPLLEEPKTTWLDKGCDWGKGADDPTGVLTQLNDGIYANKYNWIYTYPRASCWKQLVEGTYDQGDCVRFAEVWCNLSKCLGVGASMPPFEKGTYGEGLVTISPATALDGKLGNAYPEGGSLTSADRWVFTGHQVGSYGWWLWAKYYDPTCGKTYNNSRGFIEWDRTSETGTDAEGFYIRATKGSEYVKLYARGRAAALGSLRVLWPLYSVGNEL